MSSRKQLDWARQVHTGVYLTEIEGRYEPLLQGDPRVMTQYCQQRADECMTLDHAVTSDYTNYPAAARWYDMAARFAHEAAGTEELGVRPPEPARREEAESPAAGQRLPAEPVKHGVLGPPSERRTRATEAYTTAAELLDGIEDGTITDLSRPCSRGVAA